jgi:hypothetical protein
MLAYLDTLAEEDLVRRRESRCSRRSWAEEIPLPIFVGAMFEYHWNDHAAQLAKIRQAIGLSAVS